MIHSRYHVGIDGISLPLLRPVDAHHARSCIIYSWNHMPEPGNPKAFLILILVLETGMAGTFVAQDLILFFVFFEVVLLPMYFMIGVWGGEQRAVRLDQVLPVHAVRLGADARWASWRCSSRPDARDASTFQSPASSARRRHRARRRRCWIFAGMFLGFAIKVPMFPFHTWLPDAHTEAPTHGLGDPGRDPAEARHLRLHPHRPPDPARGGARRGRPWIGLLAVIGIIYGALVLPRPDRHEAADRVLVGRRTWAS